MIFFCLEERCNTLLDSSKHFFLKGLLMYDFEFCFIVFAEKGFNKILEFFHKCLTHLSKNLCFFIYVFTTFSIKTILISHSWKVITHKWDFSFHLLKHWISRILFLSQKRSFCLIFRHIKCNFFKRFESKSFLVRQIRVASRDMKMRDWGIRSYWFSFLYHKLAPFHRENHSIIISQQKFHWHTLTTIYLYFTNSFIQLLFSYINFNFWETV